MRLYRFDLGNMSGTKFIPAGYAPTKTEAIKRAKKLFKHATYRKGGWRIVEVGTVDRLTARQWADILTTDMLACDLKDTVVLSDFVTEVDEVHRFKPPRKKENMKDGD